MNRLIALLLLLGLAGAVGAETLERQERDYQMYRQFAGDPVDRVRTFRIYDWKPLGRSSLAIWTRGHNDGVYLLELDRPCPGLDWAHTIGITDSVNTVMANFDKVQFRDGRNGPLISCIIREIRPVDYKAVRAARKARAAEDRRG